MANSRGAVFGPKMRLLVAIGVFVVIVVGVVFLWHEHRKAELKVGGATVAAAPDIKNVPGAGNPSQQYIQNQNLQNQVQAIKARKTGTSDVPTITRSTFVGNPADFGNLPKQPASDQRTALHCPLKKVVVMYKPNPASCTVDNLRKAKSAGVTAEELACQGCACPNMKLAGYTAGELKDVGFTAEQLRQCGFTLSQLVAAGYTPAELRKAGFTARQLAAAGFTPGQLAAAGYTPGDIRNAGFTAAQLAAADLGKANCNLEKLKKDHAAGVSAAALRADGCGAAALKAAGYTAAQLKAAGFSAKQLKDAGFSAQQLKAAGFTAGQLKNAGFSNADLKAAGYTPAEIKAADAESTACSVANIEKERANGVSAKALKDKGCSLEALKAAGYTAAQLKAAGFSAKQLKDAGFTAAQLKAAGFSAGQLKGAGFTAAQLKNAGFTAAQLKAAGFSAKQLKAAGFTASQLKAAGFNAGQLKAAGFTASQLKSAGFTAAQLKDAGFSAAALHNAGFTPAQLKAAGYTRGDLLRAGISPETARYPSTTTDTTKAPTKTSLPSVTVNTPEARLAEIAKLQQKRMNAQQRVDAIQQLQGSMTLQAQKLLTGWSNFSQQTMAKAPPMSAAEVEAAAKAAAAASKNGTKTGPIIKAGTVMFAVLETSINSDEKSPIMARIVEGPLKGGVLLGQFSRVSKRLLLSFTRVSIPTYQKSISLNAVAIDPDTARTAISGQVNNHYLLRYGTLFASSFVQGLSSAIQQSGSTTNCFFGFCQTTNSSLSLEDQLLVGLGTVGQQWSSVMASVFNTPPTIKVPAGVGLGILVMSDLTLPLKKPTLQAHGAPTLTPELYDVGR